MLLQMRIISLMSTKALEGIMSGATESIHPIIRRYTFDVRILMLPQPPVVKKGGMGDTVHQRDKLNGLMYVEDGAFLQVCYAVLCRNMSSSLERCTSRLCVSCRKHVFALGSFQCSHGSNVPPALYST